MPKIVFAVQPTSSPEDTATYFSNNNYTEEEIDRYTIESTEIFYDALSYDGEFLTLIPLPLHLFQTNIMSL